MDLNIVEYVKHLPLFKGITDTTLLQLVEDSEIQMLVQGEVLIQKGMPCDWLFIIHSGLVKVVGSDYRNREVVLNKFGAGQIIGEVFLLKRLRVFPFVVDSKQVQAIAIKTDMFMRTIKQSSELAENFIKTVLQRTRFSNRYVEKAIELSQAVNEGDYKFVQNQIQTAQITEGDTSQVNEARIGAFLSTFFKMIEGVRRRESFMRQQWEQQFEIQIDGNHSAPSRLWLKPQPNTGKSRLKPTQNRRFN